MKEKTASDPDTPGFNHYMICSYDDKLNEIDTFLCNVPVQFGVIPDRWKTVTDFQILKRIKNHDVSKMRTIVLIDAEANMVFKVAGKK